VHAVRRDVNTEQTDLVVRTVQAVSDHTYTRHQTHLTHARHEAVERMSEVLSRHQLGETRRAVVGRRRCQ
jgi:hypothetical protein